jgi:hypothetical protein
MSARDDSQTREFEGNAKIGRILKNMASITLKPEDFSSPISLQMALSRMYESLMKIFESGGPKPRYVAEVRFTDDLGNPVSFAVDLGEELPPFTREKIKARIIVQLYEDE